MTTDASRAPRAGPARPGGREPAGALDLQALRARPRVLPDRIAEDISRLISAGRFEPGSRIPSERVLARELGVSRPAVREALRTLSADGVLEVRAGSGRYVTERGEADAASRGELDWLRVHRDEVAELNHVLQLVEPPALREVPVHVLPDVAVETAALCNEMGEALLAGDARRLAALDVRFHQTLCAQTPNRFLRRLVATLITSTEAAAVAVYAIPTAARHSLDQHREIVASLEAGSAEEASELLARHRARAHRFAYQEAVRVRGEPRVSGV